MYVAEETVRNADIAEGVVKMRRSSSEPDCVCDYMRCFRPSKMMTHSISMLEDDEDPAC